MKEIYKKIIEALFAAETIQAFNVVGVSPVKYVDLYKGQYLTWEKFDVAPLPAVFVDWSITLTDQEQNESLITVTLHLVYEQVLDTSNVAASQEHSLRFFDFIDLVHQAVSAIEVSGAGKLKMRTQEPSQLDRPGIVHTISYDAAFSGYTTNVQDEFNYTEEDELTLSESGNLIKKQNWQNKVDFDLPL